MEPVARCLEVIAADVSRWYESFFERAECAFEREEVGSCDQEGRQAGILVGFDHHGQQVAAREDREDGSGSSFCAVEVEAMSAAIFFSACCGCTKCGRSIAPGYIVSSACSQDRSSSPETRTTR